MKKHPIQIYPQQELLHKWAEDRAYFAPDADDPPLCLRCGRPLRSHLSENALSRALDIQICPACGMDEAIGDARGKPLPVREWWAIQARELPMLPYSGTSLLIPECKFRCLFTGPQKQFPLSSFPHPVSELCYARSDYDGYRWWTTWFNASGKVPQEETDQELIQEIDIFHSALLELPEFQSLWHMRRMCLLYAEPTSEPTQFNLYSETEHFLIWLQLSTRERDYNLYTHFYKKVHVPEQG